MDTPYVSIVTYYRQADRAFRHGYAPNEDGIKKYRLDVERRWRDRQLRHSKSRVAKIDREMEAISRNYEREYFEKQRNAILAQQRLAATPQMIRNALIEAARLNALRQADSKNHMGPLGGIGSAFGMIGKIF